MHAKRHRADDRLDPVRDAEWDGGAITTEIAQFSHWLAQVDPDDLADEDLLLICRLKAAVGNLLGEE
jgi:hypothetical protein